MYEMIITSPEELTIIGFNHLEQCRAWVDKYFDYCVIQYAESGIVELIRDHGKSEFLEGPVAWLTYPGPHFQFGCRDGSSWHHRFVSFKGRLADNYAKIGLYPLATPVIPITDMVKFSAAFDTLLAKLAGGAAVDFRTVHLLEEVMLQLAEQPLPTSSRSPVEAGIYRLKDAIAAAPEADWNWRAAADNLHVSYPYFRKIFQEQHQMPPARFLMRKKLEKAASLLRSNELSLKEIAAECGFYDFAHFSRTFRRYYGITPGRFWKKNTI